MRMLTYKRFLSNYVAYLSSQDTLHLNALLEEAENDNPRLQHALLLYMLETYDHQKTKEKLEKHENLNQLYKEHENSLLNSDYKKDLKSPFYKVFNSYMVKRDYHEHRKSYKEKLLNKIITLKDSKDISTYRVYTDLKLNPGNVNSALKYRDPLKLSEDNLKTILNYLNAQ